MILICDSFFSFFLILFLGVFKTVFFILLVGFLAWASQAIQPPPPKICGSPGGPLVKGTRIKLKDGRHLAYKEYGVGKDRANYKVVFVHGFGSCRHDLPPMPQVVIRLSLCSFRG